MAQVAQDPIVEIPDRMRRSVMGVLVITIVLATAATYLGAQRLFVAQTQSVALGQHALYLRSLNEAVGQHQHLPFILAQNPLLADRVARGDGSDLNETLRDFSDAAGLEAIYVMTLDGDVVAASNFADPGSFIGQNYAFRPYFQGALEGHYSDYFAIGVTTGRPGYFVAGPLASSTGDVIGVIAIKLDISELQAVWEDRGEHVLATNADGVVLVSSDPDWLYRTVGALDETRRAEILTSRQFADETLQPLSWDDSAQGRVILDGQSHFLTSGQTELVSWTVHFLSPTAVASRQTLMATGVLGSIIAVLIGFAVFLRSRRISAALAVSQRRRKELIAANVQLVQAQDDLARASKLAALGQLAASVTHELGQPISALKNHLMAAEIGNEITSPKTADNLKRLTARMEGITKQLRFFARRTQNAKTPVEIGAVIQEALALLQHDIEAAEITMIWHPPGRDITMTAEQLQLEQAMVNLIRNAVQASEGTPEALVQVELEEADHTITIRISDSGAGFDGLTLDQLQEPFFSTKSSGVGMGLGLAITAEIVRDHGGVLTASDGPTGGAVFTVTLPKSPEDAL